MTFGVNSGNSRSPGGHSQDMDASIILAPIFTVEKHIAGGLNTVRFATLENLNGKHLSNDSDV